MIWVQEKCHLFILKIKIKNLIRKVLFLKLKKKSLLSYKKKREKNSSLNFQKKKKEEFNRRILPKKIPLVSDLKKLKQIH